MAASVAQEEAAAVMAAEEAAAAEAAEAAEAKRKWLAKLDAVAGSMLSKLNAK